MEFQLIDPTALMVPAGSLPARFPPSDRWLLIGLLVALTLLLSWLFWPAPDAE